MLKCSDARTICMMSWWKFTGYETLRTHELHLIGGPPASEPPHAAVTLVRTELVDGVSLCGSTAGRRLSVALSVLLSDIQEAACIPPPPSSGERRTTWLLQAAGAQDGSARDTGTGRANKQVLQLIFTEENQSLQLKIKMLTAIRSYFDG
jgi:hypothetical protein